MLVVSSIRLQFPHTSCPCPCPGQSPQNLELFYTEDSLNHSGRTATNFKRHCYYVEQADGAYAAVPVERYFHIEEAGHTHGKHASKILLTILAVVAKMCFVSCLSDRAPACTLLAATLDWRSSGLRYHVIEVAVSVEPHRGWTNSPCRTKHVAAIFRLGGMGVSLPLVLSKPSIFDPI